MIKKLPDFSNRLTNYYPVEELKDVIKQLKKYGAKENVDFIIREEGDISAVYINYSAYQPNVSVTGIFKKSHPLKNGDGVDKNSICGGRYSEKGKG